MLLGAGRAAEAIGTRDGRRFGREARLMPLPYERATLFGRTRKHCAPGSGAASP